MAYAAASSLTLAAVLGVAGGADAAPPSAPPAPASAGVVGGGLNRRGESLTPPGASAQNPAPVTGDTTTNAQPATGKPAGVSFTLKEVQFGPSRFLSKLELQRLARSLIGKRVSINDLRALVGRINVIYARRHIVTARAFLPPQRVAAGIVRIDFIEGRLGRLTVDSTGYTPSAYVRRNLHVTSGETIDVLDLRNSIAAFNRNNDAQLSAQLQPGTEVGETDIRIAVTDPPRTGVQFFADTYGYQSTGRYEGGAFLRHSDLLLAGDRSTLYLVGSGGSITGTVAYNIPVFDDGSRLGVSYARSQIHVVAGSGSQLDTNGYSDTWALNYGRPLVGGEGWSVALVSSANFVRSSDHVAGQSVSDNLVDKGSAGVTWLQDVFGVANLTTDLTLSGAAVDEGAQGTGTDKFFELNTDFSLQASPFRNTTFKLAGAGQYITSYAIPGSQLLQIGGPASVRGYSTGIATGANGYYVNGEAHYLLTPFRHAVDAYAFYDGGEVFLGPKTQIGLQGTGAGFNTAITRFATLQVFYAHGFDRVGDEAHDNRVEARGVISF